jgi:hypothetical protein
VRGVKSASPHHPLHQHLAARHVVQDHLVRRAAPRDHRHQLAAAAHGVRDLVRRPVRPHPPPGRVVQHRQGGVVPPHQHHRPDPREHQARGHHVPQRRPRHHRALVLDVAHLEIEPALAVVDHQRQPAAGVVERQRIVEPALGRLDAPHRLLATRRAGEQHGRGQRHPCHGFSCTRPPASMR